MTLKEYRLRMKASRLIQLDEEYLVARMAWMNREIQATKRVGKRYDPIYKTFKSFFDYENKQAQILGEKVGGSDDLIERYKEAMRAKYGHDKS